LSARLSAHSRALFACSEPSMGTRIFEIN
jgi:hypothetical protein